MNDRALIAEVVEPVTASIVNRTKTSVRIRKGRDNYDPNRPKKKKQRDPRAPRISLFFITINSNKKRRTPEGDRIYDGNELKAATEDIMEDHNAAGHIFLKLNKGRGFRPEYENDQPESLAYNQEHDIIISNRIEGTVEVGPEKGFIHLHGVWRVEHRTNIHLNIAEIKRHYSDYLGLSNVHVDVKPLSSGLANVMGYINKDVTLDEDLVKRDAQPYAPGQRGTGFNTSIGVWSEHAVNPRRRTKSNR